MLFDKDGNICPEHIKEIIESDKFKTTILTKAGRKEAEDALKEEIERGMKVEVEGEEIYLLGYQKFEREDSGCVLYVKVSREKQQLQYLLSEHPDAELMKQHFEKNMCPVADSIGFQVMDMRQIIVESMGAMNEFADIGETQENNKNPDLHPLSEYPLRCYKCLNARNQESCEFYHTKDCENCTKTRESIGT